MRTRRCKVTANRRWGYWEAMRRAPLLVVHQSRCIGEVLPISPLPKLAGMTPTLLGSRRHQKQLSTCEPAEMATAVAGVKRQARAYQCVSCDRSYPKHFKVGLARKVPDAVVLLQRGMPRAHPQASDMCDVCHSLFKRAKPMPLQVGAAATQCSSTAAPKKSFCQGTKCDTAQGCGVPGECHRTSCQPAEGRSGRRVDAGAHHGKVQP